MSDKHEIFLIKLEAAAVLLSDSRSPNQTIGEFRAPYLARIRAIQEAEDEK